MKEMKFYTEEALDTVIGGKGTPARNKSVRKCTAVFNEKTAKRILAIDGNCEF